MKRRLRQSIGALWAALPPVFTGLRRQADYFNHVMPNSTDITTLPAFTTVREAVRIEVGEAVQVTLTGSARLDPKSSLRGGKISAISLGVRFTDNFEPHTITVDEDGPEFYGSTDGDEPLPARYQLLGGTNYARTFPNIVVARGGEHTFKHRFSFTLTEAGEVVLWPSIILTDESYPGSFFGAGATPKFSFEYSSSWNTLG